MAKQSLNTLKNWFKTGLKPLQSQFWHWMDSFWHKDEKIPATTIDGLQGLLDSKVDKKDTVDPDQVGVYDPAKNYVYDPLVAEYVSFSNPASSDIKFTVEGFYRLIQNAPPGETPETNPSHWAYQGTVIGEITINDVVGLREELDDLAANSGGGGEAGLPDTWYADNAAIRNITGYQNGYDVGVYDSESIFEFNSALTNADDDDTYLKPNDLAIGAAGRWVKRKTFSVNGHTHLLSSVSPDAGNANRLPVVNEAGDTIGYTPFTAAQIVQLASIDMSDIGVGESKILTSIKLANGEPAFGGSIAQLDKLGAPTLDALLDETNPLWIGDTITLTGDNRNGALGENSVEFVKTNGDFFICRTHDFGTTALNGYAFWIRNRGQDALNPNIPAHAAIIAALATESGWSAFPANYKQLAPKSKMGTWYRPVAGGYTYKCIDEDNGWVRDGTPPTDVFEITTASHPTLTANLIAHDFAISGMYQEGTDPADEAAAQAQEFWDTANNAWYKRNMNAYWAKMV